MCTAWNDVFATAIERSMGNKMWNILISILPYYCHCEEGYAERSGVYPDEAIPECLPLRRDCFVEGSSRWSLPSPRNDTSSVFHLIEICPSPASAAFAVFINA